MRSANIWKATITISWSEVDTARGSDMMRFTGRWRDKSDLWEGSDAENDVMGKFSCLDYLTSHAPFEVSDNQAGGLHQCSWFL
jgi:hypothetical protein